MEVPRLGVKSEKEIMEELYDCYEPFNSDDDTIVAIQQGYLKKVKESSEIHISDLFRISKEWKFVGSFTMAQCLEEFWSNSLEFYYE